MPITQQQLQEAVESITLVREYAKEARYWLEKASTEYQKAKEMIAELKEE